MESLEQMPQDERPTKADYECSKLYQFQSVLYQGRSKIVHVIENKSMRERVIKVIEDKYYTEKEIVLLKKVRELKNKHFTKFYQHHKHEGQHYILLEKYSSSLATRRRLFKDNLEEVRRFAFHIATALRELHQLDVVHGSLDLSNILVHEGGKKG